MKIFRKDKDKDKDKDNKEKGERLDGSHGVSKEQASIRTRTSTSSPLLFSSNGLRKDSSDGSNNNNNYINNNNGSSGSLGRSSQATPDAKKQHAIRIGDTRFYGRIICRAKALYDYPLDGDTLQVEDEEIKLLKFKKGDIINVYEQDQSGWWAGEYNDEKGIFPGSYMKVLEEDPIEQSKNKAKSQVSREELLHTISSLEIEKEELMTQQEHERTEFNKILKEIKSKAEAEIQEMRRILAERDEVIQSSTKKIRTTEKELEEVSTKLATKEVELMTMELEVQEYKNKIPDFTYLKAKQETKKGMQSEVHAKNMELQEINRQRFEAEKGVREAKAKLTHLESQILRKVMTSPIPESPAERDDLDMLKKQLGEEVFEKRRMENEIREMKRLCVDVENLKTDKARLEVEAAGKVELENKLAKIEYYATQKDTILLGVISKDPTTLTVASMKELLSKVRKGIASQPTNGGLKSSSVISGLSSSGGTQGIISPTPKQEKLSARPKTASFYIESQKIV